MYKIQAQKSQRSQHIKIMLNLTEKNFWSTPCHILNTALVAQTLWETINYISWIENILYNKAIEWLKIFVYHKSILKVYEELRKLVIKNLSNKNICYRPKLKTLNRRT